MQARAMCAMTHMRMPCRLAFAHVADRCKALMLYIAQQGPDAVLDVDELLLRESMDVMGGRT